MAVVFESVNANFASFSATVTVAVNAGTNTNRCIFAVATCPVSTSTTINSAVFNGVPMTAGTQFICSTTNEHVRAFWIFSDGNIPTGTSNLIVTCSDANGKPDCVAVAYSGVDGAAGVSGEVTGTALNTAPTWVVTSTASDIVVALWQMNGGSTGITPTVPAVSRYSHQSIDIWDEFAWEQVGASTVTIAGTFTTSNAWAGTAVSLKSASGGGGGATLMGQACL
jgi:hypothetical protein